MKGLGESFNWGNGSKIMEKIKRRLYTDDSVVTF